MLSAAQLTDPDPVIFVSGLQDGNTKDKRDRKKSKNRRNQGFSYYFCLMIEGSGS
jgi:hypothetical protein